MSHKIPLEALLRRASRLAEQRFAKGGEIEPLFLADVPGEDKPILIVAPIVAQSPREAHEIKDNIAAMLRAQFAEHGVTRYAGAMECWFLENSPDAEEYIERVGTLKDHPNRREAIDLFAEDARESLRAFREIVRPARGKPYLGKLGKIERPPGLSGRFVGLLPQPRTAADGAVRIRSSKELPDDVGTVFVTAVPASQFQVMGRRDPRNGELCAGSLMMAPPGIAELTPPDMPIAVEVVTGPEAEWLVAELVRRTTEKARRDGMTLEEFMARASEEE